MPNIFTFSRSCPAQHRKQAFHAGHSLPHKTPGEEKDAGEEGLDLPVNPDEGTPLIPDEGGHVEVPA